MTDSNHISAGAVLYAVDMRRISAFYAAVVGLVETRRDADFVVLERGGFQLIVLSIPERLASTVTIAVPPRRREETPIKLVFVVPDVGAARQVVADHGGVLHGSDREWRFADWRVCDGHDPEGNVFQLRESIQPTRKESS